MRTVLENFFSKDVADFTSVLRRLESEIPVDRPARNDACLERLTEATHRVLRACARVESLAGEDETSLDRTRARFRKQIAPWFDRSRLMHRAKTKPRGYPGDYKLLAAMYDELPISLGIGGYVDLYLLRSVLARAVRARMAALRSFLAEEASRRRGDLLALNVACGPCREYLVGVEIPRESRLRVVCIDQDEEALEYVKTQVAPATGDRVELRCARYNALRMASADATVQRFGRADVIYSIGLCDYIPDRHLVRMLQGWRESLQDEGVLYVALKDANRYDKTECQWLADWHFFQRTEEDCRDLYRQAGFDVDALEMARDATGAIMNFVSRLKHRTVVRVDKIEVPSARARTPFLKPAGGAGRKPAARPLTN